MREVNIKGKPDGAFGDALIDASVGDRIIYWVGTNCGGPHKTQAMKAFEAGLVHLTSRPVRPEKLDGDGARFWEYLAIRSSKKVKMILE